VLRDPLMLALSSDTIITIAAAVLGPAGLVGGIYALLKLRPEAGQFTVNASEGVVMMQAGLLDRMRAELARAQTEIDELRMHMTQVFSLQQKVRTLEQEREVLVSDNTRLKARVSHLESEVKALQGDR
jgi:FtsZ-binding cell division protein ZapB